MAKIIKTIDTQRFNSSQLAQCQVLEQLQCSLAPKMNEGWLVHLLQPRKYQPGYHSEVPKCNGEASNAYFLPVRSKSGLICCCLKYEKHSSAGAVS